MLAYVYGVVPISLCRGGGCGVSRGKGRGVRIDFDEDDGPITGNPIQRKDKFWHVSPLKFLFSYFFAFVVADAWRALKSPSLGESSLEGAASGLSTTSPSEGLSVAPGGLSDTPNFNTLAGGALGACASKYSRWIISNVICFQEEWPHRITWSDLTLFILQGWSSGWRDGKRWCSQRDRELGGCQWLRKHPRHGRIYYLLLHHPR